MLLLVVQKHETGITIGIEIQTNDVTLLKQGHDKSLYSRYIVVLDHILHF